MQWVTLINNLLELLVLVLAMHNLNPFSSSRKWIWINIVHISYLMLKELRGYHLVEDQQRIIIMISGYLVTLHSSVHRIRKI